MYFYLQAPLYLLGGSRAASLYAGALLINLAALVAIFWTSARENPRLAGLIAAACLAFAWRAPRLLASPWTAHVPVLPALAFMVLCAAIAVNRTGLLPLAIFFGSLAVQTNLALGPAVAVLTVALTVHLAVRRGSVLPRRMLLASAALILALWALPVAEALTRAGGNAAALWAFFVAERGDPRPLADAFTHWSYALAGILRPDFALPWGSRSIPGHTVVAGSLAVGQIASLALIIWTDVRRRRRFEASLALAMLLVSLAGLWACTRIRDEVRDHEVFWLSAVGAVNLALIVNAVLRFHPFQMPETSGRTLARTLNVGLLVLTVLLGVHHLRDFAAFEVRRPERAVTLIAHEAVHDFVRAQGITHALLAIDEGVWGETAGVVLRLYQEGTAVAIADPVGPMFRNLLPPTGREDALISFTRAGRHAELQQRPGNHTVLEHHPVFVNALRLPRNPVH